jgi:uncharacterized phiE125 gp8 family phage protein
VDPWGTYAAGFAEPPSARYCRTVPAVGYPVTVDEVRAQCALAGNQWDEYLAGLVAKATDTIEHRLNRALLTSTWTASLDAFPDEVRLEMLPVTAVTQVFYVDYNGDNQILPANQYQVDISSPDRVCRIRPVWGLIWPITRVGTFNAVVVTFTAGYAAPDQVPPAVRHAICLLAAHWFRQREPVSSDVVNQVPMTIDWVLQSGDSGNYA